MIYDLPWLHISRILASPTINDASNAFSFEQLDLHGRQSEFNPLLAQKQRPYVVSRYTEYHGIPSKRLRRQDSIHKRGSALYFNVVIWYRYIISWKQCKRNDLRNQRNLLPTSLLSDHNGESQGPPWINTFSAVSAGNFDQRQTYFDHDHWLLKHLDAVLEPIFPWGKQAKHGLKRIRRRWNMDMKRNMDQWMRLMLPALQRVPSEFWRPMCWNTGLTKGFETPPIMYFCKSPWACLVCQTWSDSQDPTSAASNSHTNHTIYQWNSDPLGPVDAKWWNRWLPLWAQRQSQRCFGPTPALLSTTGFRN